MTAHFSTHLATALLLATLTAFLRNRRYPASYNRGLRRLWKYDLIFSAWALLPFGLIKIGAPEKTFDHFLMNIFLFFPVLKHHVDGGMLIGSATVLAVLGAQYLYLLSVIVRLRPTRNT